MEMIISILRWIFFETIYGIVAIGVLAYAISWGLRRIIPKVPNPGVIAAAVALIGLLTIPSIPRYLFERNVFAQIEGKPWIRVVDRAYWGELSEPLTLIKTPVGFLKMAMPNSTVEGGFREIVLRYDEEPIIQMVDPDCTDFTIWYSQADTSRIFRYVTKVPEAMTQIQRETYCIYDWTKEKEALRTEFLRQSSKEIPTP